MSTLAIRVAVALTQRLWEKPESRRASNPGEAEIDSPTPAAPALQRQIGEQPPNLLFGLGLVVVEQAVKQRDAAGICSITSTRWVWTALD